MYFKKTHWHSQCVLETYEVWYLEMSLKTHWEISLINVWSVWSVLWRTSPQKLISSRYIISKVIRKEMQFFYTKKFSIVQTVKFEIMITTNTNVNTYYIKYADSFQLVQNTPKKYEKSSFIAFSCDNFCILQN